LAGWHYQRGLQWITDPKAPSGKRYVTFRSERQGQLAQALQGFAVDGRAVKELSVSLWVRGEGIRPTPNGGIAALILIFYDENRSSIGEGMVGPWRGSFAWERQTSRLKVPLKTRGALVRIGLMGASGELSVDGIEIGPAN